MKSFLKIVLASFVGVLIAGSLFFIIMVSAVGSAVSKSNKPVEINDNSILHLKLNYEIKDRGVQFPLENFDFNTFEMQPTLGLYDILENIKKAANDPKIKGIYLDLTTMQTGIASVEEIRSALQSFKSSNKFVIAHADYYTFKTYYLASVADKVFLTPTGIVDFKGLSAQVLYFENALEKLGIETTVFRHGKYKSALEPFMQDEMSEANREQLTAYLETTWHHNLEKIAESRSLAVDKLDYLANNLKIANTQACINENLVDSLFYPDQLINYLKDLTGTSPDKDLNAVAMTKYNKTPKNYEGKGLAKDKIALVFAEGDIMPGEGDENTIGADKLSRALRKARTDSTIKAIVLRVNSPGGSALASEIILREVKLAKQVKPVIVSMGSMAASGGYYIACMADTIIANTTTLTGSIGVFGALINIQEFMNDKAGINIEVVNTNDHADLFSPFRKMDETERMVISNTIDTIYHQFLTHVSNGRNMTIEQVDDIAQGRIWSGKDAFDVQLTDV